MTGRPASPAPDLVALVGSRIAHDLASPIGAIANGVELLGLGGLDDSPELALISESVANASARIKAFRIAFGLAQPGQVVAEAEIRAVVAAANSGKRAVSWPVAGDVARGEAKLVLLALMCLETAMPWGGAVRVRGAQDRWQITAMADRFLRDKVLWDAATAQGEVQNEARILQPAHVQFALIGAEARAQGRRLAVKDGDGTIEIRV